MAPPKSKDTNVNAKNTRDKPDGDLSEGSPPKRRRTAQTAGHSTSKDDSTTDIDADIGKSPDGDDTTVGSSPSTGAGVRGSSPPVNPADSAAPSGRLPPVDESGGSAGQRPPPSASADNAGANGTSEAPDEAPDNSHMVFKRRPWFSNMLMERLPPMLDYHKPKENIFALSKLPVQDLDWGNSTSSVNKLCGRDGALPVTVWVVGIIDALWLFNPRSGEPEARISVGVVPLADHGLMVARNVLCDFSRPVSNSAKSLFHVSASKWTSTQVHGERANQNQEFQKVYDARHKFVTKNKMTRLAPEELKKGDLVLMETQISRYNTKKDKDGKIRAKTNKAEMVEYKVSFDLVAVSLLEVGPKVVDDEAAELGSDDEGL